MSMENNTHLPRSDDEQQSEESPQPQSPNNSNEPGQQDTQHEQGQSSHPPQHGEPIQDIEGEDNLAAVLEATAEYIKKLQAEDAAMDEELEDLRRQAAELYSSQDHAPVPPETADRTVELYQQHVRQQSAANWKYWIFDLMSKPLVESFNEAVSGSNPDEIVQSSKTLIDQYSPLQDFKPAVFNQLLELSGSLSGPSTSMQAVAMKAISASSGASGEPTTGLNDSNSTSSDLE